LVRTCGRVLTMDPGSLSVSIAIDDPGLLDNQVEVLRSEIARYFCPGDSVEVKEGMHTGQHGLVIGNFANSRCICVLDDNSMETVCYRYTHRIYKLKIEFLQFCVPEVLCDTYVRDVMLRNTVSYTGDLIAEAFARVEPDYLTLEEQHEVADSLVQGQKGEPSYIPRKFYDQDKLDAHARRILAYIEKYHPQIKRWREGDSLLDGAARKYTNWKVYAHSGPFKAKFGLLKSFSHDTAIVEFESGAAIGSAVQTVKRKDLVA